jgi:Ca-activated chloride channel family protein
MSVVNWVSPLALWLALALVPGVAWFLWWSWKKRQKLVRLFVAERLMPELLEGVSEQRLKIKMGLIATAVLFLMLAMARPQWGFVWQEANQRGRDILIAVDTSRSMLAEDMAPNRLTRAKLAALDLLRLAKEDRLGVVAFAGAAFLQCPLTLDDEAFRQNIASLDTSIIPQGGTALTEAIETAMSTFAAEEGDNERALIIFTDGEDHETGAIDAAERAANRNIKVFTVGLGTPNGEVLRITDENGKTNFVRDASGNVVKSRLNEDLLRQIATKGNGFYVALREGNAMQALYQRGLEPMRKTEVSSKLVKHLNEQFHWPLGIAIALLLAEAILPTASKKRAAAKAIAKAAASPALVMLFLMAMLWPVANASPARAYRDYKEGHYKDSRNEYERLLEKRPDDARLNYNAGAAAYKAGAFDAATKRFTAATKAEDLHLQEMAYYGLGNANFRAGAEQNEPDKKMALWQESIQNYESALKLNPQDANAAHNRDFVKAELEKLKKEQQKDNKDKSDNKDKDKKDDKQEQDKNDQKKDDQDKQDNKDQKDQQKQDEQKDQDQKDNKDSKSDQQKKDEEQKKQEEKEKQEQQAGKDKQDEPGDDKKDGSESGEKNQAQKDQEQKDAEEEARAASMAQMTPKQAQQMLDAQKNNEKALIYRMQGDRKKSRDLNYKDW